MTQLYYSERTVVTPQGERLRPNTPFQLAEGEEPASWMKPVKGDDRPAPTLAPAAGKPAAKPEPDADADAKAADEAEKRRLAKNAKDRERRAAKAKAKAEAEAEADDELLG